MSPTRKPKPPDKGAPPEHKPSRKVALEEVMRSLQDLVSNELATGPAKPSGNADTATVLTKTTEPAEKPAVTRSAYTANMQPTVPPVATEPTAEPEPITADQLPPTQPPATAPDVIDELPDLGAEPLTALAQPPSPTEIEIPAEGLQQELPYLEDIPPAPSANPPAATPAAEELQMAGLTLEELPPVALPHTEVKADSIADNNAPASTAAEISWDDFPVLEEAVELTEETDTDAATHGMGTALAETLPPADTARRLAIQVAARLNVELRKSGQAGLSSDIITRLARLLQEALAKGAANMENTPPDKH
jgi:hypothetical protein